MFSPAFILMNAKVYQQLLRVGEIYSIKVKKNKTEAKALTLRINTPKNQNKLLSNFTVYESSGDEYLLNRES